LPVGIAARVLRISVVIHDSDSVPGLTNRVLARFASSIGTGLPIENYPNYRRSITKFVGIPVREGFKILNTKQKDFAKEQFNFSADKKLAVVIGGGLGSRNLNEAALLAAPNIVKNDMQMLIVSGDNQGFPIDNLPPNVQVIPFITDGMPDLLGAADVVVTRAGATSLAELAAVATPTIIVPNHHLASDHQTKNAAVYEAADAALVINPRELENTPTALGLEILRLAKNEKLSKRLGQNLHKFSKANALEQMTEMILKAIK